ncbi:hypothetical protein O3P69_016917 [Scylla paramamosain]|uniref:Reverse transcriptase domain-containing protein n=1 Tax=Scylla paramamosain TaxID=85552 RepID=A0AAW0TT40_SCYPA
MNQKKPTNCYLSNITVHSAPFSHTKLSTTHKNFFADNTLHPKITDITITVENIEKTIKELKPNSAAGPDGVSAILLLKYSKALGQPLCKLWQCSLNSGIITQQLKSAINNQHGFRKGRSCLSKFLAYHDWVLHNLAEGINVDVVFLDFAKTFDKVYHGILLHKMSCLGIGGKLGVWTHAILTVNGHKSEEALVSSGVPQGFVLGTLLFLIHLGDQQKSDKHIPLLFR